MLFNSLHFLVFFPVVTVVYFLLPGRVRWAWLLAASYYFYMAWNPAYALFLAGGTLATWGCGLLIGAGNAAAADHPQKGTRLRRLGLGLALLACLGTLVFFKYTGFLLETLAGLLSVFGLTITPPAFDLLLPVGISFYTFQSLGYVLDVWRGQTEPERHLGRYALFVAFFPQLLSGPIGRSTDLLPQMAETHRFDYDRVKRGLLRMLWGLFQKLVVADRLAIFVDAVYKDYAGQDGAMLTLATVLYAFQIYTDFAGYSSTAIGAAQVLGFTLAENFRRPYFATSVQDFWQRWHISLSAWFRDYLFYPLLRSRPLMGLAKALRGRLPLYYAKNLPVAAALLILWFLTGLWHGAAWTFVAFGLFHGGMIILATLLAPLKDKLYGALKINRRAGWFRAGQMLCTFLILCCAWVLFRAPDLAAAGEIFGHIFTGFHPSALLFGNVYAFGLDAANFWLGIAAAALVLAADAAAGRTDLPGLLCRQRLPVQWAVFYLAIFAVLVLGVYGPGFDASQFIYFQF